MIVVFTMFFVFPSMSRIQPHPSTLDTFANNTKINELHSNGLGLVYIDGMFLKLCVCQTAKMMKI